MDFNPEIIKARVLAHLRKKRVMGGVHTHYDTLKRGFPKHLGKEVEKMANILIKQGWILTKPTNYGLQVYLNKEKLTEIEAFIKQVLDFSFDN